MSVQMMGAVINNGPRDRTEYTVMMSLANYADDFGFAFPSLETIALNSRCDERTTRRQVVELERRGWIYVARKVLNGKSNVYMLNLDRLGVMVPSTAKRNPVFMRLAKMYPGTMTPIFAPEESPDMVEFSGDNPQPLTGHPDRLTGQNRGGSPDIACPPNHQEPSMEPSGTVKRSRTNPPTPFPRGLTLTPDPDDSNPPASSIADLSAAAEDGPACGPEATETWTKLRNALKLDLGNGRQRPPRSAEAKFRPIREGITDFELCFAHWWLERILVRADGWTFQTMAADETASDVGIVKYQRRLDALVRMYFAVPRGSPVTFQVLRPEPISGRIGRLSAVAEEEDDSP